MAALIFDASALVKRYVQESLASREAAARGRIALPPP
jgi:predicted nucleic acid-binding protein